MLVTSRVGSPSCIGREITCLVVVYARVGPLDQREKKISMLTIFEVCVWSCVANVLLDSLDEFEFREDNATFLLPLKIYNREARILPLNNLN